MFNLSRKQILDGIFWTVAVSAVLFMGFYVAPIAIHYAAILATRGGR